MRTHIHIRAGYFRLSQPETLQLSGFVQTAILVSPRLDLLGFMCVLAQDQLRWKCRGFLKTLGS